MWEEFCSLFYSQKTSKNSHGINLRHAINVVKVFGGRQPLEYKIHTGEKPFAGMSYVLDNSHKGETHSLYTGNFFTSISFFPRLIAILVFPTVYCTLVGYATSTSGPSET